MILGERVKKLRKSLGLTQKQFASRIPGKIGDTYIGKIERGYRYPSLKVLERIGRTYSVPVSYFFFEETVKLPVHIVSKPFICPLSPVIKIRGDETRRATCDGSRCDWWDKYKRQCVIWTIAESLRKKRSTERRKGMKIYKGKRSNGGAGGQTIMVGRMVRTQHEDYPLKHIERHSPDGFNWGYGGSGPADTALSILTDCLGMEQANQLYQLFKWEFVARWGDEWSISEEKIREWVEREKERRICLEEERR